MSPSDSSPKNSPENVGDDTIEPQEPALRLQKFLAACGLGSRRACEELVTTGRVTIDGKPVTKLGTSVRPESQIVELDGERLRMERKQYFVLNKPTGILCTNKDPQGRPRVVDLFPDRGPRLFTVGRLDEDSEGLLVVTNDGDMAQRLAHPKFRIFRTYHVQIVGNPKREVLESLEQGFFFTEGKFRFHRVKAIKKQGKSTHLEVVLAEGQNREIRRLFARVGHKVMTLKRVAFGSIKLGKLAVGKYREMSHHELNELRELLKHLEETDGKPDAPLQGGRRKPGSRAAGAKAKAGRSTKPRTILGDSAQAKSHTKPRSKPTGKKTTGRPSGGGKAPASGSRGGKSGGPKKGTGRPASSGPSKGRRGGR